MSVFTIHGIKNNTQKENMLDRGLLDYQKYYQFLKSRPDKFVSIEDSLNNKGDALTIDDSTRASMEAAILVATQHRCRINIIIMQTFYPRLELQTLKPYMTRFFQLTSGEDSFF